jgi:hypothetical protein
MCEPGHPEIRKSREARLVEEILADPALAGKTKGAKMREVLRFLWSVYQKDPTARVREVDIATAVYDGPTDLEDSTVRRTQSRLRAFLTKYAAERVLPDPIRVVIPERRYQLTFETSYDRRGIEPVTWFWRTYKESPLPVRLEVFHPMVPPFTRFPAERIDRIRQMFQSTIGREVALLEADELHHPRDQEAWNTLHLAVEPSMSFASSHSIQQWKEHGLSPICPHVWRRASFSDDAKSTYTDTQSCCHVLLNRAISAHSPHGLATVLHAHREAPFEAVLEVLFSNEKLYPVIVRPEFVDTEENVYAAPSLLQIMFEIQVTPERADKQSRENVTPRCLEVRSEVR